MIPISVIVPCRNEKKHVCSFLDSLLAQELSGFEWEIIIADGMSDDGTRELLAEYQRNHRRIHIMDNPGRIVSTGLNAAIRAARGEVVIRLDVHTEYAPDYIRRCVETLEASGADNAGGPLRVKPTDYRGRVFAAAHCSPFAVGGSRIHNVAYEGYVDTVYLGCWRKVTIERLGLFDETLVRNQDDELNLRLIRSGGKIWQSPGIVSWYQPRKTVKGLFRQYCQYGFWKVAVIRKHRIPASWRHLVPGAFVAANLTLLLVIVVGTLGGTPRLAALTAIVWAALGAVYASACLAASGISARNHGWAIFPALPPVFAIYHVSYGLGFVLGMFYWSVASPKQAAAPSLFTEATR
jgi:succinoglycan biosynthesis protein ExoA